MVSTRELIMNVRGEERVTSVRTSAWEAKWKQALRKSNFGQYEERVWESGPQIQPNFSGSNSLLSYWSAKGGFNGG